MTVFEITSSEISLRPRFSQTEIDLDKIWYRGSLAGTIADGGQWGEGGGSEPISCECVVSPQAVCKVEGLVCCR